MGQHDWLENLREHMKSEEGQKSMEDYFLKKIKKDEIKESQLERFHENYSDRLEEIFEKIIHKYESSKYVNREYGLGFEPRRPLYFFMLEYAQKHGRELTDKELEKYENDFTGEIYFIQGYYIQIMHGQGSVIRIDKDERLKKLNRILKNE